MFRQEEVFPGGWPDKTVEAMRKRRFEQSIRQMEPLDANRLETLTPGALARRLEQSWQEVKRRPMYHQQLTQVWKQVLETIDAQEDCLSNVEHELVERASNQNFVPVVDDKDAFIGLITRKAIIRYCREKLFPED